jgi:hypothetical protein
VSEIATTQTATEPAAAQTSETVRWFQQEIFQLLPSSFSPQSFLASYFFVESHGLQLVHQPRAHLHHAMPMPKQLSQIAILPTRDPDPRETIFQQQVQNVLRVLTICLLFPNPLGTDLRCILEPWASRRRRDLL